MTPTKLETLRAVRELISDPKRWTRGAYARDAEGDYVAARSDKAVCWCVVGAVAKVTGFKEVSTGRPVAALLGRWGLQADRLTIRNDGPHITDRAPRPAPARHRNLLAYLDKLIAQEEAG